MFDFLYTDISINIQIGEIIAYVGAFLLAICGAFEALRSVKLGRCEVGSGLLISWLLGEILLSIYNVMAMDSALFINYGFNILFILIMMRYKYFPRKP